MDRRKFLAQLGVLSSVPIAATSARSESSWPQSDIFIVAGYKPGGGVDMISRLLAPLLEERLNDGVRISVLNKPGASGAIATKHVRSQPADGYRWLATGGFNRGLRAMGIDDSVTWKDWQFYGADASLMSFSVPMDSPVRDFEDLIRRAKDNPEKLTVSTSGVAGNWHLGALLVAQATDVRFRFIPYQGGKSATVACIKREVDVACSGLHEQLGAIRSGDLRHLATGASETITLGGIDLESVTVTIPHLSDKTPIGGGACIALRRETDPVILSDLASTWLDATSDVSFVRKEQSLGRLVVPVVGETADKRAAYLETISANLLHEMGLAKSSPQELGVPSISEFDNWWPPKDYNPRISAA